MASVLELVAGTAFEVVIFGVAGAVLYKVWRNASFLPQRKTLFPFNKGVLLKGERVLRIFEPGSYWVMPGQTIMPVDIRPRPLRMSPRELLTADKQGIRVRLNGEYKVIDPALFVRASTDGHAALYSSLEREVALSLSELDRSEVLEARISPADRIRERIEPRAAQLGIEILHLEISDLIPIAWAHQASGS